MFILVFGLFIAGCGKPPPQLAPQKPPEVTVAQPLVRTVPLTMEFQGVTRADATIAVRPRVQGFLMERPVDGGRLVKRGDLLFVIDQRPFVAAKDAALAEVAQRQAALKLAEIDLASRSKAFGNNAATQFEVDTATANRDAAKAQLDLAKARLTTAENDLGYTEIRAEIDGRLSAVLPNPGTLVGPSDILCSIVNDRVIFAQYRVPETTLIEMRKSNKNRRPGEDGRPTHPVLLTQGEDAGRQTFRGLFWRAETGIDVNAGSLLCEARYDNPTGGILPGTTVALQAILGQQEMLLLPDLAVLQDQAGRYVLTVVNSEGKQVVVRKNVVASNTIAGYRKIVGGLDPNDRVIVNGIQRARPGAQVTPTQQPLDDKALQQALEMSLREDGGAEIPTTAPAMPPSTAPTTQP